jgi:hypothetical protein
MEDCRVLLPIDWKKSKIISEHDGFITYKTEVKEVTKYSEILGKDVTTGGWPLFITKNLNPKREARTRRLLRYVEKKAAEQKQHRRPCSTLERSLNSDTIL